MAMKPVRDAEFYRVHAERMRIYEDVALFSPWHGFGDFGATFVESQTYNYYTMYYVDCFLRQALRIAPRHAEVWEAGVYRGDSALFLATHCARSGHVLRLFDTFKGMPQVNADKDNDLEGMFADTSLDAVRQRLSFLPADIRCHQGLIPTTFAGLDATTIAFAHVDLDIHDAILESCDFIYPRLIAGGAMVFDDYGWSNCPGAREAVDSFFASRPEVVTVLPTGQAFIVKAP